MRLDAALAERIAFLATLGDTTFFDIEPGSTLFSDDAALEPLGLSRVARSTFTAAIEQVTSIDTHAGRPSSFGLLRASLEAAAATIWLLESDDALERGVRVLSEAWGEIRDADAMLAALGGAAAPVTTAREAIWLRAHRARFGAVDTRPFHKRTPVSEKIDVASGVVADFTQTADYAAIIPSSWRGFESMARGRGESFGLVDATTTAAMFAGSLAMLLDVLETAASLFHVRAVANASG